MKQILILTLFLFFKCSSAQNRNFKIPDSLKSKSYTYLDDKMYDLRKDSTKASVYLYTYLNKAKFEKNGKEIIYAYQNILHQSPENLRLVYADTMVQIAQKFADNALIGSAYLSKGIVHYGQKKYQQAFDNYITANNYISKTNNEYLTFKVKYHIAQIKYYLGFYDEAISLFHDCLDYFKKENQRAYLNTLHSISVCHNRLGDYGYCSETNEKGLSESKRLKNTEMEPYFIHSEGINDFSKHNYEIAINKIESSLGRITENKDFANESVGNFYIGKSYWAMGKKDKALPYFLKVDRTFNEKKFIRPDQREMYETLIDYYESKNDLKNQLYNVKQLLKADEFLNETYKYLVSTIRKHYDTKDLQLKNQQIEKQLVLEKYFDVIGTGIILIFFVLLIYMTYRNHRNKKLYKKKFNELMIDLNSKDSAELKIKKEPKTLLDIPSETIRLVLKNLERFETEKKFLKKDLKQADLAAFVNTNSKYLYKILSSYKNKSFIQYINDLRIDYIINVLKEDKIFRKYTYTALAEEAGFSTSQQFSLVFKAKTGMPVNYYVDEISR